TIPFIYDPPIIPVPVIRIRINDQEPLPFMVDTGLSAGMILDEDLASKLKIEVDKSVQPGFINQSRFLKTTSFHLDILSTTHKNFSAEYPFAYMGPLKDIHQLFGGLRIAGVIGLPFFNQMTVRLDFSAKTLTLFPNPHPLLFL